MKDGASPGQRAHGAAKSGMCEGCRRHVQLEAAVRTLPDGFALFDADDSLVLCNDRFREIYHVCADALVPGLNYAAFLALGWERGQYRMSGERKEDWLARRLAAHNAPGSAIEQQLSDGRWIRILERATPDGGRVGMRIDITDTLESRMRAERAEQRLREAIKSLPAGFWLFDSQDRLVMVNDMSLELYPESAPAIVPGMSYEQILRYGLRRGQYPEAVGREEVWLEEVLAARGSRSYAITYPLSNGRWVASTNSPTSDGGIVGFGVDVTELKRQQAALEQANWSLSRTLAERDKAERRFVDIAEIGTDWVWEQDADLRFTFISESYERKTGGSRTAHLGRTRQELIAADPTALASADWDWLEARVSAREPFEDFAYRTVVEPGRDLWVRISGAPIFDEAGAFAGYRGVGSDVTSLHVAKARAEAASRAKSAFLATMSHEIRTPLNGVVGMADLLRTTGLDARQSAYLDTIRASADALLTVITDILDLSNAEAGHLVLEQRTFELRPLAERVIMPASASALASGVDLVLDLDPGHVLIRISGHCDGGRAHLAIDVSDTGIGIPEDQLASIFAPFSQVDQSYTRAHEGTGLGLAITRSLVTLMGGDLLVCSTPAEGSTFSVRLSLDVAASENVAPPPPELEGRHIVVLDPSAPTRKALRRMLEAWRATVTEAACAAEVELALASSRRPPDIAIAGRALGAHEGKGVDLFAPLRAVAGIRRIALTLPSDSDAGPSESVTGPVERLERPVRMGPLADLLRSTPTASGPGQAKEPARLAGPLAGRTVLLVDDNRVNRHVLRLMLEGNGASVVAAEDGQQALEATERQRPDLLLMDVSMPVMDGLEATRRIREREAREGRAPVPIIGVTANARPEDRAACLAAGMDDFLSKPVRNAVLSKKIAGLLAAQG